MDDAVWIGNGTAFAGTTLDLIDELHPLHDLAPDGVLPVQPRVWREHDEELAIGAVGIVRPRHTAHAAQELPLRRELSLQVRQRTATSPGTRRVTGLRHKTFDHPVERKA